jgi:hypothetical protein
MLKKMIDVVGPARLERIDEMLHGLRRGLLRGLIIKPQNSSAVGNYGQNGHTLAQCPGKRIQDPLGRECD